MGLPGREEADWVIGMAKTLGLYPKEWPNLSSLILQKSNQLQDDNLKHGIRYGAFAAATGMDVSPSFAANSFLPLGSDVWKQMMPVVGTAYDVAKSVGNVGLKTAGQALGGSGPSSVDMGMVWKHGLPSAYKVFGEMARQDPGTGIIGDPDREMSGGMQRPPWRSAAGWQGQPNIMGGEGLGPWTSSALGSKTVGEADISNAAYQNRQQDQLIHRSLQQLEIDAGEKALENKDFSQEMEQYVEAGGDPQTLFNQVFLMVRHHEMTMEEALMLKGMKNIRGMKSIENYQSMK